MALTNELLKRYIGAEIEVELYGNNRGHEKGISKGKVKSILLEGGGIKVILNKVYKPKNYPAFPIEWTNRSPNEKHNVALEFTRMLLFNKEELEIDSYKEGIVIKICVKKKESLLKSVLRFVLKKLPIKKQVAIW